jgi:hypothetical protein
MNVTSRFRGCTAPAVFPSSPLGGDADRNVSARQVKASRAHVAVRRQRDVGVGRTSRVVGRGFFCLRDVPLPATSGRDGTAEASA